MVDTKNIASSASWCILIMGGIEQLDVWSLRMEQGTKNDTVNWKRERIEISLMESMRWNRSIEKCKKVKKGRAGKIEKDEEKNGTTKELFTTILKHLHDTCEE